MGNLETKSLSPDLILHLFGNEKIIGLHGVLPVQGITLNPIDHTYSDEMQRDYPARYDASRKHYLIYIGERIIALLPEELIEHPRSKGDSGNEIFGSIIYLKPAVQSTNETND